MSTVPPADLLAFIEAADLDSVDRYLQDLDSDERTTVRRWFERSRPWFRELRSGRHLALEIWQARPWVEAICAVSLLGPATAAKRFPWRDLAWFSDAQPERRGEEIVRRRLQDAEATWVARFVET